MHLHPSVEAPVLASIVDNRELTIKKVIMSTRSAMLAVAINITCCMLVSAWIDVREDLLPKH